MTQDKTVLRAILISILALVLFDLMALIIKALSERYTAAELSVYRNIFGLLPAMIALWASKGWHERRRQWRVRQPLLLCSRGVIVALAQLLFYLSLGRIAFATASTITYSGALFTTVLAVLILHEKVGVIRWGAVMIGFVGVIMVIGIGRDAFTLDALLPLGAAFLYALTGVTARLIDSDVPSPLVNLYSSAFAILGSLMVVPFYGGFSAIQQTSDAVWIVIMGALGGAAVLTIVISYRMTEQSNLAPFSYFGIPIAFALGWLFFGETPVEDLFPGALLIIAGGLMVIWRQRQLTKRSAVPDTGRTLHK